MIRHLLFFLSLLCFFFACQQAEYKHNDLKGEKQKLGKFKKGEREILLKIKPDPFEDFWVPVGRLRITLGEEYCIHQNYMRGTGNSSLIECNRFSKEDGCLKIESHGCYSSWNQCTDSIDRVTIINLIEPSYNHLKSPDWLQKEMLLRKVRRKYKEESWAGQLRNVYFFESNGLDIIVCELLLVGMNYDKSLKLFETEIISAELYHKDYNVYINFECMPNDTIGFRQRSLKALRSIQIESL